MKQWEQPGTRGKTCPPEERKGAWGGMVEQAGRCGTRRPEAGQGRAQEPRGPPQGQREPPRTCEQGRKPLRTALRTPLGTAAQGAWRAATCGGGWAAHLPGPAPRTMCSSCPRASRGSPHPGAAWAARPPCGGEGTERGRAHTSPQSPWDKASNSGPRDGNMQRLHGRTCGSEIYSPWIVQGEQGWDRVPHPGRGGDRRARVTHVRLL